VRSKILVVLVVIFAVGSILNDLYVKQSDKKVSVSVVNTSDSELKYAEYPKPDSKTDLVVLPEYSDVFSEYIGDETQVERDKFIDNITNENSLILTSRETIDFDNLAQNKVTYYSPEGEIRSEQAKTFIITGGEYLTYWFEIFYKNISPSGLQEYNISRKVKPGDVPESPTQTEFGSIGTYACSGVISPNLYRSMARQRAQILTNSASLTIFAGAETYHQQTEGFAIFHAAANQKPFVQSTKMGKAYIIDSSGSITDRSDTAEDKLLQADIRLSNSITMYTRLGEITIYGAIIYMLWIFREQKWKK
jgi:apolipoprotein N-acyltransferase